MSDPPRLVDGGGDVPPELRELLAGARRDVPNAAELDRLAAGLPFLAPTSAAPPAAASGIVGKAIVALVVGGVIIGGGVWLNRSKPPAVLPPTEVATAQQTLAPRPARLPATAAPSASPARAQPAPAARSAPSEAALLRQAQAALRQDPAQALALTREHRRRFPQGALAQEREVIAIEALSRLGQTEEAKKAATDFTRQYPDSAHRKKVEATTGGSRSP